MRHRQWQAPVEQATEQQVHICAVGFDVALHLRDQILRIVARRVVDVVHIRIGEFQHAEADVWFSG